jgi:hypothetical protein
MAKSILDEALDDAKLLKETAIENARNVLVEAISPQIREFFDSQMNEGSLQELSSGLADLGLDPSKVDPKLLMQMLAAAMKGMGDGGMDMGPEMGDEPTGELPFGDDEEEDSLTLDGMYENNDEESDEDKEEKDMDEVVKIDEQDLAKAWAEVVREEALDEAAQVPGPTVSAEFADAQNPNKNATGGLGEPGAPGERGLEDKEKQEMWKDHEPPASQDWTVKEHMYRKQIELLQNENRKLKGENNQLNVGVEKLQRSLTEVNLFNSKLLFTNKLLQNTSLTNEQRLSVIEAFDRAESLREVELVYKSLSESFKIAGVLSEGKQTGGKKQRSSRFTTSATANMLREQSERPDSGAETISERWQTLAGVLGD